MPRSFGERMTFPNWHIHTGYIALAAILSLGAYIGVHSWLAEHDARLLAVQQEKISEAILPVLGERQRQLVSAAGTHAMACRTRFPWLAWHRSRAAWRRSRCRPWRSAAG